MTSISIIPEVNQGRINLWRAIAGEKQASGKTAGEALDRLTLQLNESQTGLFLIYEQWQPDEFFTAGQQQRLEELMNRWRALREQGRGLLEGEQRELEALVDAELNASTRRAEKLALEMKP